MENKDENILNKLITALKTAKNTKEIEKIEKEKDDLIWSLINYELKDMWYEVLGDAKRGLYF